MGPAPPEAAPRAGRHANAIYLSTPIRLLGIQLSNLGTFEQLPLFDRYDRVGAVVDSLRARFGFATVSLATGRGPRPRPA